VQTNEILIDVITQYFDELKPVGKVYLFFDEIQEVEGWEKVINSYLANDRIDCEIFLTGSNANLLSTELSTYVTGRYVEIAVFPFSFREYSDYHHLPLNKDTLIKYLESSGMPELFALKTDPQKISYLMSLKDSILMNDIVKRFNIKNPKLLELLLDFLIDNIGKLFSFNSIVNKLNTFGQHTNVVTVSNYIHYLELTFLVHSVSRYDLKGKKILEGERKYYLNDLGFSNYLHSSFDNGINRKLENYIYQGLLQAGCKIYVGNILNLEIDFVAELNHKKFYIQVTYLLHSEEVINREYGNLEKIRDNWPKLVISLDDVSFPDKDGIQHISAWDFSTFLKKLDG
jgi:predicted AAA+ superfamily ATPase